MAGRWGIGAGSDFGDVDGRGCVIALKMAIASAFDQTVPVVAHRLRSSVRRRILCNAMAERPVLLGHLDQGDEYILGPHAGAGSKPLDDALVERSLLLDGARVADGELDDHQVVAAG